MANCGNARRRLGQSVTLTEGPAEATTDDERRRRRQNVDMPDDVLGRIVATHLSERRHSSSEAQVEAAENGLTHPEHVILTPTRNPSVGERARELLARANERIWDNTREAGRAALAAAEAAAVQRAYARQYAPASFAINSRSRGAATK